VIIRLDKTNDGLLGFLSDKLHSGLKLSAIQSSDPPCDSKTFATQKLRHRWMCTMLQGKYSENTSETK